jgi:hypothetical protein
MGTGQTATGQDISGGANYASNVGNALGAFGAGQAGNIIGAGNARASGYMGMANTASGALGQGLNFYQNRNLMNQLQYNNLSNQYGSGNVYMPGGGGAGAPSYATTGIEF